MKDQAKHFAIAIAITVLDVVMAVRYGTVIWLAWSWNIWYREVFLLATCSWAGSLGDIWAHALRALRQPTGDRGAKLSPGTIPATQGFAEGGSV